MKRTWLLVVLLLVGATAWMFAGCSDSKTTNSNLEPLDTNSAAFLQENVSSPAIAEASGDAENLLDLVNMIPGPGSPARLPVHASLAGGDKVWDTVSHTYENGWHIFYYSFTRVDSEYHGDSLVNVKEWSVNGYDSVRLWYHGDPVQFRVAADSLESHGHGQGSFADAHNSTGEMARHRVIKIEGNPWVEVISQLVLNANSHDTLWATFHPQELTSCSLFNTYSGMVDNVVFDSAAIYGDACPASGSLQYIATVSLECSGPHDTVSVNGTWSIHATFNGSTQIISLSNGLAQAVHVDTCGSSIGPAAVPFAIHR
jgi:hypothetical protein